MSSTKNSISTDLTDAKHAAEHAWLVHFRPVLRLLWPVVDFSDEVLAKLTLQGATEASHLPIQTALARPLMNFFLRRGIMELDGLSIFRSADYQDDPDYKYFPEELDHICFFVAAKGGAALIEQVHCRYRPTMDQIDKVVHELRKTEWLDEWSYETVSEHCQTINDAISLETKVQQQSKGELVVFENGWSLDAFLHFMSFLSRKEAHPADSIEMEIPLELLTCSQQAQQCLENVLKAGQFECLYFKLDAQSGQFFFTTSPGLGREKKLLEKFPDAYVICFRAIVEGFSSREKRLEILELMRIDLTSFEDDHRSLVTRNPFSVLFSRDNIFSLHVEMLTKHYTSDPDFEIDFAGDESQNIKVDCLCLSSFSIGPNWWKSMWNKVSELKHLGEVAIDPRDNEWMTLDDISLALNSVCSLPKLVSLQLMATEVAETVDLTEVMLSLLDKGSIEAIRVTGYKNRDYYSYEVNVTRLVECFKTNSSLWIMDFSYVKLTLGADKDPTKMLLDALAQSNNSSLESIRLSDKSHVYADAFTNDFRESVGAELSYMNYKDARKIDYLIGLNTHGLAKIRAKGAQLPELVKLLSFQADECCSKYSCDHDCVASFRQEIVAIANEGGPDGGSSNQGFDKLYRHLREDVGKEAWVSRPQTYCKWCLALEEAAEHTSILYGLLHARPDLWCNAYSQYDSIAAGRSMGKKH